MGHGFALHSSTPAELKERLGAEARGDPFLAYRDAAGAQRLFDLEAQGTAATVGRGPAVDLDLEPDQGVSRLHAELQRIGSDWVLSDDGLSRNGSYVNGERVAGRRRLHDSDVLRFGGTDLLFRAPAEDELRATHSAQDSAAPPELSPSQRQVLAALCRPFKEGSAYARPATNRDIAEEVFLSVDAVKGHLRALFEKLGIEGYPQNEKRLRLVEQALQSGAITRRDL